jgi:NNP family nitrate/nitrite transporter-like MFS transporter
LTPTQIANSNIVSLAATLVIRVIAGPLCDRFGPRLTFAGCLLAGSIPTALAGTIHSANGLYVLRFFVGILGGSFVPCQVWSTGFFDKNVVGTANAFAGGWGNSGGGITYFIMPIIFDSLVHSRGLTPHVAWRVTFLVPFVIIVFTAITMLIFCPDTPSGKWSERFQHVQESLQAHGVDASIVQVPGGITDKADSLPGSEGKAEEAGISKVRTFDHEAKVSEQDMLDTAKGEIVEKPSLKQALKVVCSPQTLALAFGYFNSFGAELAINSILGAYYLKNFPKLLQTGSGRWAAMFGLLNVVTRPLGGIGADLIYKYTKNLWLKKALLHGVGVIAGALLIVIGKLNPHDQSTMFGLIAVMAVFLEAGNGVNYALVPHVYPAQNGIISGIVGAVGNLGGIVYAIIFRYQTNSKGTEYDKVCTIYSSHYSFTTILTIVAGLLDHWCYDDWHELGCLLDSPDSQGTNRWSLSISSCLIYSI